MQDLKMLAYLGDAVYELAVRKHLIDIGVVDPKEANKRALSYVTASCQAWVLKEILDDLTEEEAEICRKGRNLKSDHAPKSATFSEYRMATALEILLGWMYENDCHERLNMLFSLIFQTIEEKN